MNSFNFLFFGDEGPEGITNKHCCSLDGKISPSLGSPFLPEKFSVVNHISKCFKDFEDEESSKLFNCIQPRG